MGELNGTTYWTEDPVLMELLEELRLSESRVRLTFMDGIKRTGYIGRNYRLDGDTTSKQRPLIVWNARSVGGRQFMDHTITKVEYSSSAMRKKHGPLFEREPGECR